MRLAARGIRVVGDSRLVLDGVDLDVRAGRCLAVLGPNGAGKSTLLRVLSGERVPDGGTVAIDGEVRTATELREGTSIGAAVADPSTAPPEGTAGADPDSVRQRVAAAARRRGGAEPTTDEVLDDLGLVGHAGARADQLSSGLRQRAQLACALVAHLDVLLLDDPTAFLDARTAVRVAERVAAAQRTGAAVVLATHDLDLVRALADDVVALEDGRVVSRRMPSDR